MLSVVHQSPFFFIFIIFILSSKDKVRCLVIKIIFLSKKNLWKYFKHRCQRSDILRISLATLQIHFRFYMLCNFLRCVLCEQPFSNGQIKMSLSALDLMFIGYPCFRHVKNLPFRCLVNCHAPTYYSHWFYELLRTTRIGISTRRNFQNNILTHSMSTVIWWTQFLIVGKSPVVLRL